MSVCEKNTTRVATASASTRNQVLGMIQAASFQAVSHHLLIHIVGLTSNNATLPTLLLSLCKGCSFGF